MAFAQTRPMKAVYVMALVIVIFLAASSGISKVLLMQQEVEFFGKYGFSGPLLIIFGSGQVISALLMVFKKTRFAGAAIVAFTFLISLVFVLLEGNLTVGIVTAIALLLLGVIMKQSWQGAPR